MKINIENLNKFNNLNRLYLRKKREMTWNFNNKNNNNNNC